MRIGWTTLAAMPAAITLLAASALPHGRPDLIWNASASAPIGLYHVTSAPSLELGDLVVVRPPPTLAAFLDRGGYLPLGVPLLKHVAALAGQGVCREGERIIINGAHVADALARDRRSRPLPVWQGCFALTDDQLFLLNVERSDSLDGRYFGPLNLRTIVGHARPVWTERAPS